MNEAVHQLLLQQSMHIKLLFPPQGYDKVGWKLERESSGDKKWPNNLCLSMPSIFEHNFKVILHKFS